MSDYWVIGDEPDVEVLAESALAMAQATISRAMDQSQTSKATLARRMERPRSFITRILSGSHNLTVKTMAKALAECGYEIEFGLRQVEWNWTPVIEPQFVECSAVPSSEGTLVLATRQTR